MLRAATVVQVLHGLFYVLLQLLVGAATNLSFIVNFIASLIVVVITPLATVRLQTVVRGRCQGVAAVKKDGREIGLRSKQ